MSFPLTHRAVGCDHIEMFRSMLKIAGCLTAWIGWAALACADDPPISPEQLTFFEQKTRPLLIERCYACHAQEKQVKGGLRLDHRSGWQKGGDIGPAIVPGRPDESLLIKAVRYRDSDLQMPPGGKLADSEIAILEEWVRIGAPDPRADSMTRPTAERPSADAVKHWAYQPLRTVEPPAVQLTDWPLNGIDRFVLNQLEQNGLIPSADANRYHWLRRVTLDLTGLPPTRDEIQSFVNDTSAGAFETVVDRLLASPAYGERWARAWLDLVGYSDQIGSANDVPAEHAWRYRDYVIRSMNADRPFDEFLREQLAGDLLQANTIEQRQDQITATGFLVLGNVNIVEADKLIMQMDLVDQQIEKVGKVFLGMTLNCVRCHDHKFDPISLRDYYGLAGIFASTDSTYKDERGLWSTVTKNALPETLDQFNQRQAQLAQHERQVRDLQNERAAVEARIKELDAQIEAEKASPERSETRLAEFSKQATELQTKLSGFNLNQWHLSYLQPRPPVAFGVKDSSRPMDARMQVRGNPHVLGQEAARGFVKVATFGTAPAIGPDQSGRLQLADWLTHAANPLVSRVTVNRWWEKLFGKGIVKSVDYVGLRSEPPTHPDLLEYLAGQFIRDGWSQKRIIRLMALSHTYREQVELDADSRPALAQDPDNRLYWRMSPRRLDAEMLRDAALAVTGRLENCAGGPALAPEFIENVGGLNPKDVNPISFRLNKFRENQSRIRTVYLPVVRSTAQRGPADVLNFFDFPQPARMSGDRPTTTVASQALFLLNGPLLKDASQSLADELLADPVLTTDSQRIAALYLRVLNRPPAALETAEAEAYIQTPEPAATDGTAPRDDPATRWRRLIHALMTSNAFLFRL